MIANKIKKMILLLLCIVIVSYLKSGYVSYITYFDESLSNFLYTVVAYFGDEINNSLMLKVIWITPILFSVFMVSKETYLEMINFKVRSVNRRNGFVRSVKTHIIKMIIIAGLTLFLQGLLIILFTSKMCVYDNNVVKVIFKYIIENLTLSICILTLAIFFRNYTYSFVVNFILIFITMIFVVTNFIPVVSLFAGYEFNIVSVILCLLLLYVLYIKYLKFDFLGGEDK